MICCIATVDPTIEGGFAEDDLDAEDVAGPASEGTVLSCHQWSFQRFVNAIIMCVLVFCLYLLCIRVRVKEQ